MLETFQYHGYQTIVYYSINEIMVSSDNPLTFVDELVFQILCYFWTQSYFK